MWPRRIIFEMQMAKTRLCIIERESFIRFADFAYARCGSLLDAVCNADALYTLLGTGRNLIDLIPSPTFRGLGPN